jgi:hypothetical protein
MNGKPPAKPQAPGERRRFELVGEETHSGAPTSPVPAEALAEQGGRSSSSAELIDRHATLESEVLRFEAHLVRLRNEVVELETRASGQKEELDADVRLRQAALKREEAELSLRKSNIELEIEQFRSRRANAERESHLADARLQKVQAELKTVLEQKASKEKELVRAEQRADALEISVSQLSEDETRRQETVKKLKVQMEGLESALSEREAEHVTLTTDIARDHELLRTLQSKTQGLRAEQEDLDGAVEQQRGTQGVLREQLRTLSIELARIKGDVTNAKAALADTEAKTQELVVRTREELGIAVERQEAEMRAARAHALESTALEVEQLTAERLAAAQAEASRLHEDSVAAAQRVRDTAQSEAQRLDKESQAEAARLMTAVQTEVAERSSVSRTERERITTEASAAAVALLGEARSSAAKLLAEAKAGADAAKAEAAERLRIMNGEYELAKQAMGNEIKAAVAKAQSIVANGNQEAESLREAGRREILDLRQAAQQSIDEAARAARTEAQHLVAAAKREGEALMQRLKDEAEGHRKQLIGDTERELEARKSETIRALAEMQYVEKAKIASWKEDQLREFDASRQQLFKRMIGTIGMVVDAQVKPFVDGLKEPSELVGLSRRVTKAVEIVMKDRHADTSAKTKAAMKADPLQLNLSTTYLKKMGMRTALSLVVVILAFLLTGKLISLVQRSLAEARIEQSAKVASFGQAREQMKKASIYSPKQTSEYKDTFTDNVLYTSNFVAMEQDEGYQRRWVVALNRFFIRELDLSDGIVVKVVPFEKALIRELAKLKAGLRAENPDEGIENMRAVEEKFLSDMSVVMKGRDNLDRYLRFKAKFYAGRV